MVGARPAGRAAGGRDGGGEAQADAGWRVGGSRRGRTTQDVPVTSRIHVFISRAMGSPRKVLIQRRDGINFDPGQMRNLKPKRWGDSTEEAGRVRRGSPAG